MKVLVLIDVYGWAYEKNANAIKKYSKHEVTVKRLSEWVVSDIKKYEILHEMSWTLLPSNRPPKNFRKYFKIVASSWSTVLPTMEDYVAYQGEKYRPKFDMFIGVKALSLKCREMFKIMLEKGSPNIKYVFIPEAVDTNFYTPTPQSHEGFNVGWSGNKKRPDKRFYLLKKLGFPITIMAGWGQNFFNKPNRPQEDTLQFYHNLDAHISVSTDKVEGGSGSRTILEAMACGLPVVATRAGSEFEFLLDKEWIVDPYPDKLVIKQINEKLAFLRDNPDVRKKVGERNRKVAVENYCYSKLTKKFDEIYELAYQ